MLGGALIGLLWWLILCGARDGVAANEGTVYDFTVKDAAGEEILLETYRDARLLLIVNVASQCGLTDSNYKGLRELHDKYAADGLQILAFPCDQFAGQEPGTAIEVEEFAKQSYGAEFPVFEKIDVNGLNAAPLFKFLKERLPGTITNGVKWNFTKFLVADGIPVKRYSPTTPPGAIESDIIQFFRADQKTEL